MARGSSAGPRVGGQPRQRRAPALEREPGRRDLVADVQAHADVAERPLREGLGEALIPIGAAAELALTDEERARLDEASALPLLYPYWHQAKTASDRLSPADLSLLGPHLG